ncbi:hypothetical protein EXIGLDRAFT_728700 [Exidia glandulosa HHB12029]|uniref:Uncharacterized protein n=1 Tax=Exidia glandulosa HHB12029 TaxID=1314781 RepID=A0A165LRX9_EXIGL|nr:hypothetical protein EXIGLDRAFT_728700 [Exidia glandulosa HHB12029]
MSSESVCGGLHLRAVVVRRERIEGPLHPASIAITSADPPSHGPAARHRQGPSAADRNETRDDCTPRPQPASVLFEGP